MSRDAEIVNIVASGRLLKCSGREKKTPPKSLDLLRISRELWNVQYNPRRFSAAIFRLRSCQQQQQQNKPQNVTVLLFSTGRVVCCGTKCKSKLALHYDDSLGPYKNYIDIDSTTTTTINCQTKLDSMTSSWKM